jgi:hypothetical protein
MSRRLPARICVPSGGQEFRRAEASVSKTTRVLLSHPGKELPFDSHGEKSIVQIGGALRSIHTMVFSGRGCRMNPMACNIVITKKTWKEYGEPVVEPKRVPRHLVSARVSRLKGMHFEILSAS